MENTKKKRKQATKAEQKGITLIALIVTIIVLIILAGVAISMITDNNGVLNSASQARTASIIGEYKERVAMAQMSLKTEITRKMLSSSNYIATSSTEFPELAKSVAKEFGVTLAKVEEGEKIASIDDIGIKIAATSGTSGTSRTEGYTVAYYLDQAGDSSTNGAGYIVIWFTNNSLRSSIDRENATSTYNLVETATTENQNRNQAVLVSVIQVENYSSSLSSIGITSINDANSDIGLTNFGKSAANGNKATTIDEKLGYTSPLTIAAEAEVPVDGIALDKSTLPLVSGATGFLTATISPNNATEKGVTWSTSNSSIASISTTETQSGTEITVTAGSTAGTAHITATSVADGTKSASCTVTVTAPVVVSNISTSQSYVGYYADLNNDGEITEEADGIIYVDLALAGSGSWNGNSYSWSADSNLKNYTISSTKYDGEFGEKEFISLGTGGTNARFIVMALNDVSSSTYYWYKNAYSDSNTEVVTATAVKQGAINTTTMLGKWNNGDFGTKTTTGGITDMWGQVTTGWFIPSKDEWAAFGDGLNVSSSTYEDQGLSGYYWSSSQFNAKAAWCVGFNYDSMSLDHLPNSYYVRLSATF